MKIYNKLVRDKIPEIIEAQGVKCKTKKLCTDEYKNALDAKMLEELEEYYQSHTIGELADLLEVIYAAAKARGFTEKDLEKYREEKAAARGRFDQRIMLVSVGEDDDGK